ncbi:endonuclease III-like protein 1 [Corticium candelabrum]|uniref:endonuclease III-like protein 1 n=1 Tax=Corticium candelabrum TaxID=121492 RepID=UPI002E25BA76|nr:endonuclease III-like protein 1 [Corticium candelabrum]
MYCARANKLRVFNNMSALTRPRLRGGRAINLQRRSSKRRRVDVKYEDEGSSRDSQMDKVWKPDDWRAQFDNIVAMRRERDAPVDKMGAEKQAGADLSPKVSRFHVLVSLMLSSQTKDQVTDAAMTNLRDRGLTIENILTMEESEIGDLIYPVGFWKRKAQYLKKTCAILRDQYDSDIPRTVKELCQLPGVGPKMAHLTMNIAWKEPCGIGVDTHVHRISNRLGWVKSPTTTPEQTRVELESWLPRKHWIEINLLLVGFGQQTCLPVSPKCRQCLNNSTCPFGRKETKR